MIFIVLIAVIEFVFLMTTASATEAHTHLLHMLAIMAVGSLWTIARKMKDHS